MAGFGNGQRNLPGLAASVLVHPYQGGIPFAVQEIFADADTNHFRSHHNDIDIFRRLDKTVVNVEAAGKNECFTRRQSGGNVALIDFGLDIVGSQDEENVAFVGCFGQRYRFEAIGYGLLAIRVFPVSDNEIET
jgi:hypothetical protein